MNLARNRDGISTSAVVVARLALLALLLALWWTASQTVTRNLIPTPVETALAAARLWSEGRRRCRRGFGPERLGTKSRPRRRRPFPPSRGPEGRNNGRLDRYSRP